MKRIFENFREFTNLNENKIEDMVDNYYSDLSEEEREEKKEIFF